MCRGNIGLAIDGTTVLGNAANGILVSASTSMNFIGGPPSTGTGNIISGNNFNGILYDSPADVNNDLIIGNSIGTIFDGTAAAPNGMNGINIDEAIGLSIEENIISGNKQNGIRITGDVGNGTVVATEALVYGNSIGTTADGKTALGNGQNGIYLYLADKNTIGQAGGQGDINVISGNSYFGIEIGSSSNLVVNNYIGTDVTGEIAKGNGNGGISIGTLPSDLQLSNPPPHNVAAVNNTIGGTGGINSTLNLISGNKGSLLENPDSGDGIMLLGTGVTGTLIEGNYIGIDIKGLNPLSNQNDGIYVKVVAGWIGNGAPTNTTIGGAGTAGNVISANGEWGVEADFGTTGLLQNNIIGFNYQGQDPNKNMKNGSGEVTGVNPPNWTSLGNQEQ